MTYYERQEESRSLEWTGERMVPEAADADTFWEHIERYRFSLPYVVGKTVLDIACGEGYGSASLAKAGASNVIGVDISEEAVAHGRARYGLDLRVGSAENIPLPDASVDLIVSFETIEHVSAPVGFLDECIRVLKPRGTVIISTPNRDVYRELSSRNPFHCSELSVEEFASLLEKRFKVVKLFGQRLPSPWFTRLRGFGRLWRYASSIVLPLRNRTLTEEARGNIVEICCSKRSKLQRFFAPETVKSEGRVQIKRAAYVVAVVSGKLAQPTEPKAIPTAT